MTGSEIFSGNENGEKSCTVFFTSGETHKILERLKSNAAKYNGILLRVFPKRMLHYGRGRPRGKRQSMAEVARIWYLIRISEKYGLDTKKFLRTFVDAWTHGKASCKDILVQCRQKTIGEGVFLVTQDQKVVAQLSLSETALKYLPEVDLESLPREERTSATRIEKMKPIDMKIKDVNSAVKWVNLKARVVEKSVTKTVFSRFGNPLGVSTAIINDKTGSIKLPLWNAQIGLISVGDTVQIENGRVGMFRGELQVSVGKNGKLKVVENKSS